MAFTLKQLRYFVAAAELGSITKATKTLYISQPSISAAIGHLEEEFGIELFVRHQAKGLSLTPTGKRFVGAANRLLLQADSLNQYVTSLVTEIGGTVDVGCMVTLAPLVMPSAIASFKRRYPAATVNCHEFDHEQLIKGLHDGSLEMAAMYDLTTPAEFDFVPIAKFPTYALVPLGHHLEGSGSVSLEQLAPEPLVLLDLPHTAQYFRSLFELRGLKPNIAMRTHSPHMARSLVANGLGYSLLNAPARNDRAFDGNPIRSVPLADDIAPLNLGIATQRGQRLTRTASEFLEHMTNAPVVAT